MPPKPKPKPPKCSCGDTPKDDCPNAPKGISPMSRKREGHGTGILMIGLVGAAIVAGMFYYSQLP